MKQYSCPQCNYSSTRRWNLERHIKKVHDQEALPSIQATKASQSSTTGLGAIFEKRLHTAAKEIVNKISSRGFKMYAGHICERCLLPAFVEVAEPQYNLHSCNELWLLDYPEFGKHKDTLSRYAKDHLPELMANIIREAKGKEDVHMICVKTDLRFPQDSQTPSNRPPHISGDFERDMAIAAAFSLANQRIKETIKNHERSNEWRAYYVELTRTTQPSWFKRAKSENDTILSDEELLEFLQIRNTTILMIREINQTYIVRLALMPKPQQLLYPFDY